MAAVKHVEKLPVLNQSSFPSFPNIPTGAILIPFGSRWQNAEREYCAGIIVTACERSGEWKPVDAKTFGQLLGNKMFRVTAGGIIDAVWEFVNQGLLEMIEVEGLQYIVPTPGFAQIALAEENQLRVID